MAIEYSFAIEVDQSLLQEVQQRLKSELEFEQDSDGVLSGSGIVCWVISTSAVGRAVLQDALALQAPVKVLVRIGKFDDYAEGMRLLFAACVGRQSG